MWFFPHFYGLGNPKCGLGHLKVWKGLFNFSNIIVIKLFRPLGMVLPRYIDGSKEMYRSQWLLLAMM